jgi:hypothetical protein
MKGGCQFIENGTEQELQLIAWSDACRGWRVYSAMPESGDAVGRCMKDSAAFYQRKTPNWASV